MIWCHERDVHDGFLKSYGVFYFSNKWWYLIPDADCSGVEKEHRSTWWLCNGHIFNGFNRPGGGVMLIMLFNIL